MQTTTRTSLEKSYRSFFTRSGRGFCPSFLTAADCPSPLHHRWLKALVAGCSLLEPQPQTRLTLDALLLQIVTWQARARRLQRSVRVLRQLSFSARTFANIAQRHCTEPELPLQTSGVKAPERCFVNHHGLFDSDVHESAVSSSRMSGGTVLDAISCTCGKPSCECELDRTNSITVAPNLSSSSSMTVNSSGAGHCDKQEHFARRSTNDASGGRLHAMFSMHDCCPRTTCCRKHARRILRANYFLRRPIKRPLQRTSRKCAFPCNTRRCHESGN
eukprot:3942673-Pleurochrysis_carterae.AAC.1